MTAGGLSKGYCPKCRRGPGNSLATPSLEGSDMTETTPAADQDIVDVFDKLELSSPQARSRFLPAAENPRLIFNVVISNRSNPSS